VRAREEKDDSDVEWQLRCRGFVSQFLQRRNIDFPESLEGKMNIPPNKKTK
jgi:hypothetical protein